MCKVVLIDRDSNVFMWWMLCMLKIHLHIKMEIITTKT